MCWRSKPPEAVQAIGNALVVYLYLAERGQWYYTSALLAMFCGMLVQVMYLSCAGCGTDTAPLYLHCFGTAQVVWKQRGVLYWLWYCTRSCQSTCAFHVLCGFCVSTYRPTKLCWQTHATRSATGLSLRCPWVAEALPNQPAQLGQLRKHTQH